jgi:radical SAM protein with 4Fe4S-binding SPASM domain
LRQALSALYFAYLVRWKKLPQWLMKGGKTIPTAAGATGMGCIGFPIHPVWEITSACNLRCRQCHAAGGKAQPDELTTEEGKRLIDELAQIPEFRMLVFTGGEPLVRKDVFELAEYAASLGFQISIATNGTLITPEVAKQMKQVGVVNVAIGLNSTTAEVHESITNIPGSFEKTMRGIYASKEAGLALQLNATVMTSNLPEVPHFLDLADKLEAEIVLLYQLVPVGRGEDDEELTPGQYASLMKTISQQQRNCLPVIEPICSPIYWAYLLRRNSHIKLGKRLTSQLFQGCVAGSGLCYIKPNGDVWACPFLPISAGNVRELPLSQIWREAELFRNLRDKSKLKGKCGSCDDKEICGGCRGRAYAHYGDYLAEDPSCFLFSPVILSEAKNLS